MFNNYDVIPCQPLFICYTHSPIVQTNHRKNKQFLLTHYKTAATTVSDGVAYQQNQQQLTKCNTLSRLLRLDQYLPVFSSSIKLIYDDDIEKYNVKNYIFFVSSKSICIKHSKNKVWDHQSVKWNFRGQFALSRQFISFKQQQSIQPLNSCQNKHASHHNSINYSVLAEFDIKKIECSSRPSYIIRRTK